MKLIIILFFQSITLACFSQENELKNKSSILPERAYKLGISLAGTSFLNFTNDIKLKPRITISPSIGLNLIFQASSGMGQGPYAEFGVAPVTAIDGKYYYSLKTKRNNGKLNRVFIGDYVSLNSYFWFPLIGNYKHIFVQPEYGTFFTVGRQVQKLNNWYYNYYIGYSIFSKKIETARFKSEIYPNSFVFGYTIGYTF